ncbi:MAG: alpha/beta hydrolase [Gemmatimonadetes bacterium]|jgi:uncharacterized protein|nr:alpha/beta hydrolase [Gemmatimonadota bacterium]MBT6145103.1 alpha/beta hydrolase [Gemmatimonadota bacterium]MBT7864361.1 alpha/beta hydrolase [Gemmatimonadota bacterium]
MSHAETESRFIAHPDKGEVSALLIRPEGARWLLVLGHGASTNMRHRNLQAIAEHLADVGVATFRYNHPYMERGGGRDARAVTLATVHAACEAAHAAAPDLQLLAGGHSFSGRMTSNAAAEKALSHVQGIVFFSFPLHPAKKPGTERADHLSDVTVPMLFLSGTRDDLAYLDLLEPVVTGLGDSASLHLVDTADHGFKILKRTRQSDEDVYAEMARVFVDWTSRLY